VSTVAQRPIWRGHLRLALVSCPVALYTAKHERSAIRFNMINPETGNRIRMVTLDAETDQELERRNLVKGYEFKKDTYLIITDEDLASVRVESSAVMAVEKFVDAASVDPIYYDNSYYLAPDGKAGLDVYAVLREAIEKTGKLALTRVVIAQRERTLALRVVAGGVAAHTLSEERDLNDSKALFEDAADIKPDAEMVALAVELIKRQSGKYDPADLEDRYEARLREMIDAKLKGEGVEAPEAEPAQSNVIDIMAALKASLGQEPAPRMAAPKARKTADTRQTGLKLPIKGGKAPAKEEAVEPVKEQAAEPAKTPRKAAEPGRAARKRA
jgi:DNA end-binding protein Ku